MWNFFSSKLWLCSWNDMLIHEQNSLQPSILKATTNEYLKMWLYHWNVKLCLRNKWIVTIITVKLIFLNSLLLTAISLTTIVSDNITNARSYTWILFETIFGNGDTINESLVQENCATNEILELHNES